MQRLIRLLQPFERVGSTRSAALMRLGVPLLLWSRFAGELLPFKAIGGAHPWVAACFFVFTTATFVGVASSLSSLLLGATMVWMWIVIGVQGGHEPWTHHHTFLLTVAPILLAFTPSGGSYSVDRWLAVRRARRLGGAPPPERGPSWGLGLIALQLSSVWFWGAFDKCNPAFWSGVRMQHYFLSYYFGSDPPAGGWFAPLMQALAIGTIVVEFALPVGLWFRPLRVPLALVAVVFHAMLYLALPVGPFSLTMALLVLAYFDPDDVHAFLDELQDRPAPRAADHAA